MVNDKIEFFGFLFLSQVGVIVLVICQFIGQFFLDLIFVFKQVVRQWRQDGVLWKDVFLFVFKGGLQDGNLFLFPFLFDGHQSFVNIFVDIDGLADQEVFLFYLLFKVVPLGSDTFVELLCFFEDGHLKDIERLTVFNDELEVCINFFGVNVFSLFKFVHDGVKVHGIFYFLVVSTNQSAINRFLEDLGTLLIS